jgi:hypothetical protein
MKFARMLYRRCSFRAGYIYRCCWLWYCQWMSEDSSRSMLPEIRIAVNRNNEYLVSGVCKFDVSHPEVLKQYKYNTPVDSTTLCLHTKNCIFCRCDVFGRYKVIFRTSKKTDPRVVCVSLYWRAWGWPCKFENVALTKYTIFVYK